MAYNLVKVGHMAFQSKDMDLFIVFLFFVGSDKIRTGSASSTGAQQKEVAVASGSGKMIFR